MPSDLNQKLYLGVLPDGLKFTIKSITPTVPNRDGWLASFSNPDAGSISSGPNGDFSTIRYPIEISTAERGGFIGETKLTGDSGLYSTGPGGKIDFKFHIEGSTVVNGESIEVSGDGFFSVSSSDWKQFERPDVSNITYYWPGENDVPVNVSLTVPATIAGMPEDIYFVYAANPGKEEEKKKIGMSSTTDKDVLQTIADYAIKGILWVNEKLYGWAIKVLNPL